MATAPAAFSQARLGQPWFSDGMTLTGLLGRQFLSGTRVMDAGSAAAVAPLGGVFPAASAGFPASLSGPMQVTAGPGLGVTVNAGYCCVPHPTQGHGAYLFGLMQSGSLALAQNHLIGARPDLVVARVHDNGNPTSFCSVEVVQGVAGGTTPAVPPAAIPLAVVTVNSGATSITAGNITDQRTFTVAPGGILPVANAGSAPGAQGTPLIIYNQATGTLMSDSPGGGGGPGPPAGGIRSLTTPARPVMTVVNSSTTGFGGAGGGDSDGVPQQWLSLTFTADGNTDWEYYWRWQYVIPNDFLEGFASSRSGHATLALTVDGIRVDVAYVSAADGSGGTLTGGDAGCASYYTSPALGTTPAKGTHALALSVTTFGTFSAANGSTGAVPGGWHLLQPELQGHQGWAFAMNSYWASLRKENMILRATPVIVP